VCVCVCVCVFLIYVSFSVTSPKTIFQLKKEHVPHLDLEF